MGAITPETIEAELDTAGLPPLEVPGDDHDLQPALRQLPARPDVRAGDLSYNFV